LNDVLFQGLFPRMRTKEFVLHLLHLVLIRKSSSPPFLFSFSTSLHPSFSVVFLSIILDVRRERRRRDRERRRGGRRGRDGGTREMRRGR